MKMMRMTGLAAIGLSLGALMGCMPEGDLDGDDLGLEEQEAKGGGAYTYTEQSDLETDFTMFVPCAGERIHVSGIQHVVSHVAWNGTFFSTAISGSRTASRRWASTAARSTRPSASAA